MSLLLIAMVCLALSGGFGLCCSRQSTLGQWVSVLMASAGSLLGLAAVFQWWAADGPISEFSIPWNISPIPDRQIMFHVGLDGLSAIFLVPVFLISMLGSIYGLSYWSQADHPRDGRKLRFFYGLLPAGMALLIVARNAFVFIFGWEAMALSAFFLVTTEDDDAQVRDAGWVYLVATHLSTLLLLVLFGLWRMATGSFEFEPAGAISPHLATAMFFLALVAFGLKAGLMPFHIWLPGAHSMAPSHVSAIMSGVIIKMGIYGLVRIISLLPTPPAWWGVVLLVLGVISGVVGIAYAIGQRDLKRLLAYSSIENIGIIVIGLGLATIGRALNQPEWIALGLGGALLHVWNHSLFKSLLFFCAGSVIHTMHTREIDVMGGLAKRMPQTTICSLVGFAAVCALPPLNGFVSELLIYLGLFKTLGLAATDVHYVGAAFAAPALALVGALAVACFVKAFGIVFLGAARSDAATHAHESATAMTLPMVVLALGCATIGVAPGLFAGVLDRAVAVWLPPSTSGELALARLAPLSAVSCVAALTLALVLLLGGWLARRLRTSHVEYTGTWDCGYAAPSARMQYTGSSFAEMLVKLFGWALRPEVHVERAQSLFPRAASYSSSVADVTLDEVVMPAAHRLAGWLYWFRWMQQGSVQVYLAYILAILLLLLFWQ